MKKNLTEKQIRANRSNLAKGEDVQNARAFLFGSVLVFAFWVISLM